MDDKKHPGAEEAPLPRMAESTVHAGFPSPAQDYMSGGIDLNKELVRHPEATFYVRVSGDSMTGAGICDGDVLVVDRSLEPRDGSIAICFTDGEFLVRRLRFSAPDGHSSPGSRTAALILEAANPAYGPIAVDQSSGFAVWGIVTWILKQVA